MRSFAQTCYNLSKLAQTAELDKLDFGRIVLSLALPSVLIAFLPPLKPKYCNQAAIDSNKLSLFPCETFFALYG